MTPARLPHLLVAFLLTVGGLFSGALAGHGANHPPVVWEIQAVLEPPFTYYSVEALDPDVDELTYSWRIESGTCDAFTSEGATATWRHDDERACPHDAASHPGVISVSVSDGFSSVERTYDGGSAPHDPGRPDWRTLAGEAIGAGTYYGGNASGDDPRDAPPPVIFGEELACPARTVRGAFEPVQAVWQDENPELFPDLAGKRLTADGSTRAHAELDLVVGKLAQLFGVRGSRDRIHYEADVTGNLYAPAVMRWTLKDAQGLNVLGEIDVGELPIDGGSCGAASRFVHDFDTAQGLAIPHFLPRAEGDYTITMELARKGGERVPGSQVVVSGWAREVPGVRVYFVGAVMRGEIGMEAQRIAAAARAVADVSAARIPDYFPLKAHGFTSVVRPVEVDLRPIVAKAQETCDHHPGVAAFDWCFVNAVRASVENHFAAGAWQMGTGAAGSSAPDRIAIVVTEADMDWLYPPAGSALGFAANDKAFFIMAGQGDATVAHELAHTTPKYAWLHNAPGCTVDYHNEGVGRGHGFQVSIQGKPARTPKAPTAGLMSGGSGDPWIEQCTYWHLLHHLDKLADPTLVGLRGWLARDGAFEAAAFEPGLTFEGVPDREPGGEGSHAVRLLGPGGEVLAEYRFEPIFEDDWGGARPLIAFNMAVERPEGLSRIELKSPRGVLASVNVTPNAPTIHILTRGGDALGGDAPVTLAWEARDADGDELTYGVVASTDGGASWFDVALGLDNTSLTLDPRIATLNDTLLVRVTATDGVNSATDEVLLGKSPTPPSPPATTPASPTPTGDEGRAADTPGFEALALIAALVIAVVAMRRSRPPSERV